MLPSSGTITKDVKYAQKAANRFDLDTIKVNVKNVYDEFVKTFEDINIKDVERNYWPQTHIPTDNPQYQNISTRLRMMSLYHIAERMNYVVMGTSNKSEILTGYFTLYGDGATDMRPIGGLYKTEVWDLAEYIKVPEKIVDRPPSGGCRGDETDRDEYEFGIDYQTFDQIHEAMIKNKPLDGFDDDDIKRVKELIEAADKKSKIPTLKVNR
jgi:NAD+ synthase